MIGKKILILGSRSFAATGLYELLTDAGLKVKCFDRGPINENIDFISSPVLELNKNKYLIKNFDVVINFILLKDQDIQDNLKYIESVIEYCKQNQVKRLLHISSLSVYPNYSKWINENSEIENDVDSKGAYSSIKIAVDKYLLGIKEPDFQISFIRPGFITSESNPISYAGIIKQLPFGMNLLLGDKKTTLPLIDRSTLHKAIYQIINTVANKPVYLILSNPGGTKYSFVKNLRINKLLILPKSLTLLAGKILRTVRIFKQSHYNQLKGLFKTTYFDCSHTEEILKIKFWTQ